MDGGLRARELKEWKEITMDPNACVTEMRDILGEIRERGARATVYDRERLGELLGALDGWLARGGFPPSLAGWADTVAASRTLAMPSAG